MKHQDALDLLARETKRARRSLALERLLQAGLWVGLAVGLWALVALAGVHERIPLFMQSLTAVFALSLFFWMGLKARRRWQPPTEAEARARLARDSRLDAGAFEALRDRPSRFDAFSVALWKREQEAACSRAERARAGPARPHLDRVDRFKLRYIIPIALIVAAVSAGANAPDRLARAFIPDPGPLLGDQEMAIEAWATPAAYTHASPVSLSDRLGERIETPPSVEATVRVTGPRGAPKLVYEGQGGRREAQFVRAADGAWEAHLAIPGQGRLKIVRFHTRAAWTMAPGPDTAPRAVLAAPLATLPGERMTLGWRAEDDYGLSRLALRVRPINPPVGLVDAPPVDTPLETPAGDPKQAEGDDTLDVAPHPYAGMAVEARVVAFDALGQAGESDAMRFTMPEKVFLQPLAQASIEIRRQLVTERRPYRGARAEQRRTIPAGDIVLGNQRIEIRDYARRNDLARAPAGVRRAVTLLDALTMAPQDGYFRDLAVFLGLKRAHSALEVAENIEETEEAIDILWRTALRAEYGGAADARRALEMAQQALQDALQSGASQERVRQLMEALRQATNNYLQALVQQAIRNGEAETQEDTQDQAQISEQDIEELLRQVERLTEQGRTQEAQQVLAMLASLLSNLDARLDDSGDGPSGGQQQGGNQQMQQSMDQLSQAIGEQRQLRDQTEQADNQNEQQQENGQRQQNSQGGSGGQQQGGQGGDELAQRQAEIRQSLDQAQQQAGRQGQAAGQQLDAAGRAMRQAENALQRGDFDGAQAAQNTALDRLREGADELAAQMREGAQRGAAARTNQAGPRDPLGRLMPGAGVGDGDTAVPTQINPARAREIFDEIRRRAQDPNRPEAEREYLRRLMDRFSS